MKQTLFASLALVFGALFSPAIAAENMDHSAMEATDASEAQAAAVIHAIDADAGMINVTHEPVEALGWPKMTMDLPVTRRVDLSTVKEGSNVVLTLKRGMDKKFRVIAIDPAE
ncbi:copper-binding protein [Dichotomicrobium thermohalophilum]|uniref:Cu(I)/Ag(I) efflux system protein CusF n=1 Tax=Dichotomicrobium thermohalophilum TaxID=933063 RepID=A0A397Q4P1_9HYPH|nr:copper-binding protein [Dichotomicrobium thermohalophilum]RIA56072.1 Cu(I)/Ag(I) efflux system protein CusF [Dichotomicrobium thermohalophilum]